MDFENTDRTNVPGNSAVDITIKIYEKAPYKASKRKKGDDTEVPSTKAKRRICFEMTVVDSQTDLNLIR
jgi:hypothetical protein